MNTVRCADCGFLCSRSPINGDLERIEQQARETGIVPGDDDKARQSLPMVPVCFVMMEQFSRDAAAYTGPDKATYLIRKPRECESFTKWHPMHTPKEHREMIEKANLTKWQEESLQRERQWQDEVRRKDREWEQGQKKHEFHRNVIVGIVSAIAAGVIGYLLGK